MKSLLSNQLISMRGIRMRISSIFSRRIIKCLRPKYLLKTSNKILLCLRSINIPHKILLIALSSILKRVCLHLEGFLDAPRKMWSIITIFITSTSKN